MIDPSDLGVSANSLEEISAYIESHESHSFFIKAEYGASGQNMIRIKNNTIEPDQAGWINNMLKNQSLIVEAELERVLDFSVQCEMTDNLKLIAYTRLKTDQRGQYMGSICGRFAHGLDEQTVQFIYKGQRKAWLMDYYESQVLPLLEMKLLKIKYRGPLGIDAFIYRQDGRLKLKAVVEINLRYTMGRVAVELGKQMNSKRIGILEILNKKQFNGDSMLVATEKIDRQFPLEIHEGTEKINRGTVLLNDPSQAENFICTFSIGTDFSVDSLPVRDFFNQ